MHELPLDSAAIMSLALEGILYGKLPTISRSH